MIKYTTLCLSFLMLGFISIQAQVYKGVGFDTLNFSGNDEIELLEQYTNGDFFICGKQNSRPGPSIDSSIYVFAYSDTIYADSGKSHYCGMFDADFNLKWRHPFNATTIRTLHKESNEDITVMANKSNNDYRVLKLSSNGTVSFTFDHNPTTSGLSTDRIGGMAISTTGEVYLGGNKRGASRRMYLAKFDASQNLVYGKTITGQNSAINDMVIQGDTAIYIVGEISAGFTEDGVKMTHRNGTEGFIAKIDTSGTFKWGHTFNGNGSDGVTTIDFDKDGNLILSGFTNDSLYVNDSLLVDLGNGNSFIAKLNTSGELLGTLIGEKVSSIKAFAYDSNNKYYFGGMVNNGSTPKVAGNELALSANASESETYVLELNSDLSFVEHYTTGGPRKDETNTILLDEVNNILYIGGFVTTGRTYPDGSTIKINNINDRSASVLLYNTAPCPDLKLSQNGSDLEVSYKSGIDYDWYENDTVLISRQNDPVILGTNLTSGNKYHVLLTKDSRGCTGSSDTLNYIFVGLENIEEEANITLYPVPVTDKLNIVLDAALPYSLYDITGGRILSGTFNEGINTMNTNTLKEGSYLLKVGSKTFKILK